MIIQRTDETATHEASDCEVVVQVGRRHFELGGRRIEEHGLEGEHAVLPLVVVGGQVDQHSHEVVADDRSCDDQKVSLSFIQEKLVYVGLTQLCKEVVAHTADRVNVFAFPVHDVLFGVDTLRDS